MQYSTLILATLASLVSAQNPFSFNTAIGTIPAGSSFNITWSPSTGTTDTVSLVLRQDVGDPNNLATISTIASKITNSGSYQWIPSTSLVKGSGYAFEIVDDGNTAITNYSGQFSIDSTNTISSTTASSTTSSSSSASSTASTTNSSSTTTSSATTSSTSSSQTSSSTSAAAASTSDATAPKSMNSGAGREVVGSGALMSLICGVLALVL